jgi:hypothetical protein
MAQVFSLNTAFEFQNRFWIPELNFVACLSGVRGLLCDEHLIQGNHVNQNKVGSIWWKLKSVELYAKPWYVYLIDKESHAQAVRKNLTVCIGWTVEEVGVLRSAIMKFGVGRWAEILESNCLPGKTPAQLNLQTQRILGQQSLRGLH